MDTTCGIIHQANSMVFDGSSKKRKICSPLFDSTKAGNIRFHFALGKLQRYVKMCALFGSSVQMYRKSYCTTPGVDGGSSSGISKMIKFLCDGQDVDRQADLSGDRSCCCHMFYFFLLLPYFFGYKTEFFSFQNNPKDLDLSCKMDLDLWDCLKRVKLVL